MTFHDPFDALFSLSARRFDQTRGQESFEEQRENHDHDWPADEFRRGKLPTH